MNIDAVAQIVLSAKTGSWFRERPLFKKHAAVSADQLAALEHQLGIQLPGEFREWLILAGYGDIKEELSFSPEWIRKVGSGPLAGGVSFSQDILGNFYVFDVPLGRVYYLARSEPVFALLSGGFREFVETLVARSYDLEGWIDSISTQGYDLEHL